MRIPILLILWMLTAGFQTDSGLTEAIKLYERGKFSEAVDSLRKLGDAAPSNPEIRIWLGRTYIKLREWDKAVKEMEKAIRLQPNNARYHLWLGRACGERASHSSFITAPGWARRVVREFETARELAPEDLDVRFDLLDYYLNAPGILGGGKDKAKAEVEAIARLNNEKGYVARATVYIKHKEWDLAREELQQAVSNYPRSVSACLDLADFLLDRKDFEGALNYANKALLLESNSKRGRFIAAAAKIRLKKDLDEAAGILQDLAAGTLGNGAPPFEETYYWLGECFLAKGEKTQAREAFKSALSFNPDFGRAKDGLSKLK
jgi:tetratricopeptide (TPR) repeat protein